MIGSIGVEFGSSIGAGGRFETLFMPRFAAMSQLVRREASAFPELAETAGLVAAADKIGAIAETTAGSRAAFAELSSRNDLIDDLVAEGADEVTAGTVVDQALESNRVGITDPAADGDYGDAREFLESADDATETMNAS